MFKLGNVVPEVTDKEGARSLCIKDGAVSFKNVSFSYDGDRQVLNNVSFEVPSGKTVAIVGPSGSGKSTITRLLYRFYDVDDGSVQVDGHDVRDVTMQSLRCVIGVIPQD